MLIEQIIEFELRGPEPPGRTGSPTTGYFHDQKTLRNIFDWIILLFTAKYCRGQCTITSLPGPDHIQNLIPNCKTLNVFWT